MCLDYQHDPKWSFIRKWIRVLDHDSVFKIQRLVDWNLSLAWTFLFEQANTNLIDPWIWKSSVMDLISMNFWPLILRGSYPIMIDPSIWEKCAPPEVEALASTPGGLYRLSKRKKRNHSTLIESPTISNLSPYSSKDVFWHFYIQLPLT